MRQTVPSKISLGAGLEIEPKEEGWVNVDLVPLDGIDIVHNLTNFPYPFEANSTDYIKAKDLVEHLDNYVYTVERNVNFGTGYDDREFLISAGKPTIIAFIEECYRILKPGGVLWIQTPGWDADFLWIDPTHVRGYDIRSFDFFDPNTDFGRGTGFYTEAKFTVKATQLENKNLQFEMTKI